MQAFSSTVTLTLRRRSLGRYRLQAPLRIPKVARHFVTAMKAPISIPVDSTTSPPQSLAGDNPVFAQSMLRISDADKSRDFYENKLGMKFLTKLDFDDLEFSLLFFAYTDDDVPDPALPRAERAAWLWTRPYPTIELTHNWPSEDDTEQYVNGNAKPDRGFGHTGYLVDSAADTIKRMSDAGVKVVMQPQRFGGACTIGFVEDPDSYWCEIIEKSAATSGGKERGLCGTDPVFAQTMLRVNDPKASIAFFQQLGMKYLTQIDFPAFEFSLYFLGYTDADVPAADATAQEKCDWLFQRPECTVELTYNWKDEGEEPEEYTNGNEKGRRGFGHIGILVDDTAEVTKRLESAGHTVVKKAGPFKDVANMSFVSSPGEGYWVEIIEKSKQ